MGVLDTSLGAEALSSGLTFFAAITGFAALVTVLFWVLPFLRDARSMLNEHLPAQRRKLSVPFIVVVAALFLGAVIASVFVLVHTILSALSGGSDNGVNFGAGALIAALLGAPFLIWGTWLKYQTVRFQKEGHMTDRINTAVEQLGAEKTVKVPGKDADGKDITIEETRPNIEVRIGAILSLERIAQDSTIHDKGRDHVRVLEILCAYVRENSIARKPMDFPEPEWDLNTRFTAPEDRAKQRHERFGRLPWRSKAFIWGKSLSQLREDVQLCLQVIGRRTADQRRVEAAWPRIPDNNTIWHFDCPFPSSSDEPSLSKQIEGEMNRYLSRLQPWKAQIASYTGYRLDFTGANLQGARLSSKRSDGSDAIFSGAIFAGARLEGARLERVRFEGANFNGARMQGAKLNGAKMQATDLSESRIEGATFLFTRLELANFSDARMAGVRLEHALMDGIEVQYAQLEGAKLTNAGLRGASIIATSLEGVSLEDARLEETSLFLVQFDSATYWKGSILKGACAKNVDFSCTEVLTEQLNTIFGDASVTLPQETIIPAHWPKWRLPSTGEMGFFRQVRMWRDDPEGYQPPPPPAEQ